MGKEVFLVFREMYLLGIRCNEFGLLSVFKVCLIREDLIFGRQIYGVVLVSGFGVDVFVANILVVVYVKCGEFEGVRRVFDEIQERSVVSWNVLFFCYVQGNFFVEVIGLFDEMVLIFMKLNEFSFLSMLNVCVGIGDIKLGRKIYGYLIILGYEED